MEVSHLRPPIRQEAFQISFSPEHPQSKTPALHSLSVAIIVCPNAVVSGCFFCQQAHLPFWQPGSNTKVLGSCNGMVCVAQHGLYIWNPSTGFFLRLPEPGSVLDAPTYLWVFPLEPSGFGYVSATDEYKVVTSAISFDGSTPMGIFSSRTNSWRMKEPVVLDSSILRRGTLFNEALHWVKKFDDEEYEIIAFDLGEEEFRTIGEIPLPLLDEDAYREQYGVEAVFVFNGCLCVPVFERWNPREVQLWVMMEYGDCKSWTKLFQFVMDCDRYPFDGTVFDTDKGSIVVWRTKSLRGLEEDELIGMNPLRKDVVECSDPYTLEKGGFDVISYEETLLQVDDHLGVKEKNVNPTWSFS